MTMNYFVLLILVSELVIVVSSYKTLSSLHSIVFTNIPNPKDEVQSEYYFGKCTQGYRRLVYQEHFDYKELVGNAIIRSQINNTVAGPWSRVPDCVYIKATSPYSDMVKYNAYKFNICFTKIVYFYVGDEVHITYYYEWFIPVGMHPDISWDLYFYMVN